jgi:alpha-glucosidase
MLDVDWRADDYRSVINSGIADMINNGSTTSWLLSCHSTPRVATRYGLPLEKDRLAQQVAQAWLLTDGAIPRLDPALGAARPCRDHDLAGAAGPNLYLSGRRAGPA